MARPFVSTAFAKFSVIGCDSHRFSGLSIDLSNLLSDADDYNVVIKVGQDQNVREFHAHSVLLRARSTYFRKALSKEWAKMEGDCIIFTKSNMAPKAFEMILKLSLLHPYFNRSTLTHTYKFFILHRYLYTGTISLVEQDANDLLELLIALDEFCLKELLDYVQDQLVQNHSDSLKRNFQSIYEMSFKHPTLTKLQDHCLQIICNDPPIVFQTDLLYSLVRRHFRPNYHDTIVTY